MECIQCPHCQKQYAVNDKLRAATGKNIRCKHCGQTFEIKIHLPDEIPTYSHEENQTKAENQTRAEDQTTAEHESITSVLEASDKHELAQEEEEEEEEEKKAPQRQQKKPIKNNAAKKSHKKKPNIQWIITIILTFTLIIGAVAAFLFFNHSDLFGNSSKKTPPSIIPQELIKPFEITLPAQAPTAAQPPKQHEPNKKIATATHENIKQALSNIKAKPANKPARREHTAPSQVCKDISADYWMRTHSMVTTNMDTKTYMKLLNENLNQADEIRTQCKDKNTISNLAKAARNNHKPEWIKQNINAHMDAAHLSLQH